MGVRATTHTDLSFLRQRRRRSITLKEKQLKDNGQNAQDFPKILVETEIEGLPPSVNSIWRSAHRTWRVFKTNTAKDWQDNAIRVLQAASQTIEPYKGKVCFTLELYTKTKRRMDIDNRVKLVQDSLSPAGIIEDDSQVWELNVRRYNTKLEERIKIKVEKTIQE